MKMYASFRIGEFELALDVANLQEVVNMPEALMALKAVPDYVPGSWAVRKEIIPLFDLSKFLGIASTDGDVLKKVAIMSMGKKSIGLIFDATAEILHAEESDVSVFSHEVQGPRAIISGVIKAGTDQRLVEIMDLEKVLDLKDLKAVFAQCVYVEKEEKSQKHRRIQCITLHSETTSYALQIRAIREIIMIPEIKKTVLTVDSCLGMINLRGQVIPIVCFERYIHPDCPQRFFKDGQRIVIVKVENVQVGILVDSVDSIQYFYQEDIQPIQVAHDAMKHMIRGQLTDREGTKSILLDDSKLFTRQELVAITQGHKSLYGRIDNERALYKKSGERMMYLSFKLGHLLTTKLNSVEEIAKIDEELMQPPGYPDYVKGMMNMRGEVIMVVDLREYYGFAPQNRDAESRLLVVKGSKGHKFALIVDSVESIDTVDESDKIKIPLFLARDVSNSLRGDMKEVVEMTNMSGHKKTFMILDVPELLRKLETVAA